jgi:hypothetical protein
MPQPPNFTLAIYATIVPYLAEWKEEKIVIVKQLSSNEAVA